MAKQVPKSKKGKNKQVVKYVTPTRSVASRFRTGRSSQYGKDSIGIFPHSENYLKSLLNPFGASADVPIPDICMFPTDTGTIRHRGTFTCATNGAGGLQVFFYQNYCNSSAKSGFAMALEDSANTADGAIVTLSNTFPNGAAALYTAANSGRHVSGGIKVWTMTSELTSSGVIVGAIRGRTGAGVAATLAAYQAASDSIEFPVKDGLVLRTRPQDLANWNFADQSTATVHNTLYVHVSGAASGQVFQFEICANYEFVPSNADFSGAKSSPAEPGGPERAIVMAEAAPIGNSLKQEPSVVSNIADAAQGISSMFPGIGTAISSGIGLVRKIFNF